MKNGKPRAMVKNTCAVSNIVGNPRVDMDFNLSFVFSVFLNLAVQTRLLLEVRACLNVG